ADVAIDGERVVGRQVLRPVDRADGVVQLVRGADLRLEQRPQHPHGGAEPEVRPVDERRVAAEADPAAARLDVGRPQRRQLSGEQRLQPAGAGGEVPGYHFSSSIRVTNPTTTDSSVSLISFSISQTPRPPVTRMRTTFAWRTD